MRKYKVVWDNRGPNGMFPLSAEFSSVTDAFFCLMAMLDAAKNVDFDEDELMGALSGLYNGDMADYSGSGFMVTAVNVK